MRSYVITEFETPLVLEQANDPVPQGTEVVIEVHRCGICHTDLHLQDGYYDMGGGKKALLRDRGLKPPLVLGHEVYGRLIAAGPDANIAPTDIGKSFVVFPWIGCGECQNCHAREEHLCARPAALGVARRGGYADKCVVPHPKYLVDSTGIAPSVAATCACSGLTAYSALRKITADPQGDLLLLIGAGGVGMSGLSLARALGYARIVVADIDATKRATALAAGATACLDPRDEAAVSDVMAQPGGVATVVDFVGNSATSALAIRVLRKGGTYLAVGLFGGEIALPMPMLVQRALTLRGSYTGSLQELQELMDLMRSGKVQPIAVEDLPFSAVNTALDRLRHGGVQGRLVLSSDAKELHHG